MPKHVKTQRDALLGKWTATSLGPVFFNADGVAAVTDEQADHLLRSEDFKIMPQGGDRSGAVAEIEPEPDPDEDKPRRRGRPSKNL